MPRMSRTLSRRQTAGVDLRLGARARVRAEVSMTPVGLLAVGGLVAAILLSVPPIVRAAADARRARLLD